MIQQDPIEIKWHPKRIHGNMGVCEKDAALGRSPGSTLSAFRGDAARKRAPSCVHGKILQPLVMNTTLSPRQLANGALDDTAEAPPKHQKTLP